MRLPMTHSIRVLLILALVATPLAMTSLATAAVEPGQNPWSQWKGMPQGKDFFPIGVWAQNPSSAGRYKAMGVDFYYALHGGPNAEIMAEMRKHGMPSICGFNAYAQENLLADPLIWGWMHGDEPDLAHVYSRADLMGPGGMDILFEHWPDVYGKLKAEGKPYEGWGMGANPVIDIQTAYARIKKVDADRPVLLQLSNAVAYDGTAMGRGDHSGRVDLYPMYLAGADLVSYDVYPVAGGKADKLWLVPRGVDNLRKWGAADMPIMVIIEAGFGEKWATMPQQRAQAWMAINHGASSIAWFCHRWAQVDGKNTLTSTAMPLTDKGVGEAVAAINKEIHDLAAAINSPVVADAATVESANADVPVEITVRKLDGATYIFAVTMKTGETSATFTVAGAADGATVEVINEDRSLTVKDGKFTDAFGEFDVNLYRIK